MKSMECSAANHEKKENSLSNQKHGGKGKDCKIDEIAIDLKSPKSDDTYT